MKKPELDRQLCSALERGDDAERLQQLLALGADLNSVRSRGESFVPLWMAANMAGQEISKNWQKLDAGLADYLPNVPQRDHSAKRKQWMRALRMLIEAKADVNKMSFGSTALRIAVHWKDLEVVNLLLSNGADPNSESFSVLSKLAEKRGRKTMPGYWNTALHEAVEKNSPEIVKALLDAGADPNRADHESKTALTLAREKRLPEIQNLLIRVGACG